MSRAADNGLMYEEFGKGESCSKKTLDPADPNCQPLCSMGYYSMQTASGREGDNF